MWQLLAAWFSLRWLVHLGAVGLIILGIIDQSILPMPGSMDALTTILTARNREHWPLYWIMATAGALLGAYITYRLSRKGGKETLRRRFPRDLISKVEAAVERHGFAALFVACLLPPPFPLTPVVVAAGALQYPEREFLLAVGSARVIRYGIIVWLAYIYGRQIMRMVTQHQTVIIASFLVFSLGGALVGWLWTRWKKKQEAVATPATV